MGNGKSLFVFAKKLAGVFRFESVLMFFDVTGSYSVAQVTAGKAITDSIESKNTIIRSDADIKIYSTKILSECFELEGSRSIIGMIVDPEVNAAEEIAKTVLEEYKNKGTTLVGVNLESDGIRDITNANIRANVLKSVATKKAHNQLAQGTEPDIMQLTEKDIKKDKEDVSTEENNENIESAPPVRKGYKICPMCAEEVKAAAKICKHCHHDFT